MPWRVGGGGGKTLLVPAWDGLYNPSVLAGGCSRIPVVGTVIANSGNGRPGLLGVRIAV